MNSQSAFKLVGSYLLFRSPVFPPPKLPQVSGSISSNIPSRSSVPYALPSLWRRKNLILVSSKSSDSEELSDAEDEDEWLRMLPDKDKPLYAHSLLCIEAWLRKLGFFQSKDDRAVWLTQKPDWHAQLSLDVTDLCIRYLKIGPGNLERDVERRFSYALSREDIENAILGGP